MPSRSSALNMLFDIKNVHAHRHHNLITLLMCVLKTKFIGNGDVVVNLLRILKLDKIHIEILVLL